MQKIQQYINKFLSELRSRYEGEINLGKWLIIHNHLEGDYDITGVKTWSTVAKCSECGFIHHFIEAHMCYTYCPNCGADMRKEGKVGLPDVNKIIEGLEDSIQCYRDAFDDGGEKSLIDALAWLKKQEPRVITIDEFRQYNDETIWLETKNNKLQQLTMEGIAVVLLVAEINRWNGYGSYWRCWNKQPTDEQRREVEWDD